MNKQRGVFEKVPGSVVWWIRYADAAGRYHREKAGTRSAARALYQKRKTEALEGRKLPDNLRRKRVTFREIAADAMRDVAKRYHRPAEEIARLRLLVEWFGERAADSITAGEIEAKLVAEAEARHWKASTINHHRSLMSLAYRIARRSNPPKATGNPVRDVAHRKEDNSRVRFLSDAEAKQLRDVIFSRYPEHLVEFDFARLTGLRQSSQYSLTWEMVDWDSATIRIPHTKNGRPLTVPLAPAALAILESLRPATDAKGLVFLSRATKSNCKGEPLRNPRSWFTRAVREAGIENFHWHDLRHDYATRLRRAGTPLEDIADLLGHRSLAMSRRYAHVDFDRLREAVKRLGGVDSNVESEVETGTTIAPPAEVGQPVESPRIN